MAQKSNFASINRALDKRELRAQMIAAAFPAAVILAFAVGWFLAALSCGWRG